MKKLLFAAAAVVAFMLMSCNKSKSQEDVGEKDGSAQFEKDGSAQNEEGAAQFGKDGSAQAEEDEFSRFADVAEQPVNSNEVADTTFVFGKTKINAVGIKRIYRCSEYTYFSLAAYVPKDYPSVISRISQNINENYEDFTAEKLPYHTSATPKGLEKQIDQLFVNFRDSIVPMTLDEEYAIPGFFIDMSYMPYFAKGDFITYFTSASFYGGGAHPNGHFYLATINVADNKLYDFESLVKPADRLKVKRALVETIAEKAGKTVEQYLEDASFFITSEGSSATVEDFPIYYVGLTENEMVFCYPPYAIGPYCDGNQVYALPLDKIRSSLAIDY